MLPRRKKSPAQRAKSEAKRIRRAERRQIEETTRLLRGDGPSLPRDGDVLYLGRGEALRIQRRLAEFP